MIKSDEEALAAVKEQLRTLVICCEVIVSNSEDLLTTTAGPVLHSRKSARTHKPTEKLRAMKAQSTKPVDGGSMCLITL